MNVPFVDLKAQYQSIKQDIDAAISDVLNRSDYILGRAVGEFEASFADYCGAAYAVGVDSGYSALKLILTAYGIGYGDEVITPTNTFIATALAISSTGARPVLADINEHDFNLNVDQLEELISPHTKAVIPVHLYGQPADMDPLLEIARKYHLRVVEDACQAHGATYRGRRTGVLGDAAAFSFYPSKNLGAFGDGGAVVTNDKCLDEQIRVLRDVGQAGKHRHVVKGFNHRLDSVQAAVLNVKLKHLDNWNLARCRAAALYSELLTGLPVLTPHENDWSEHVFHLYVVRVQDREAMQEFLGHRKIASSVHYPRPIHLQPAYVELGYQKGDFPVAETVAGEILSLPMYPELRRHGIRQVVEAIRAFVYERQSPVTDRKVRAALVN